MNPDVKTKWLEALRSGEYFQGKGALCSTEHGVDRFCCLGVLCDVAVKEGLEIDVLAPSDAGSVYYDDSSAYLPESVARWADVPYEGVISDGTYELDLPGMNDSGSSFTDIANLIEKHL